MASKTVRHSVRAETLRAALLKWFSDKNDPSIILSENVNPAVDPQEDYAVVYEAVFEAASVDQMRVAIWVTDDGHVALFLESRERIARRLGVRDGPAGFPVGHEPAAVDQEALFALLEAVAAGRIAIEARVHVFGLGSVKALASTELRERLDRAGYGPLSWVAVEGFPLRRWSTHVLLYRPWSSTAA